MIRRILVANRGEIACRVIRSAQKMNLETVAVYSEPDRRSKHVEMADASFLVGPAASTQSYLDMDQILKICKENKVDAVHPGYGFLSENAAFMDLLNHNGILFIGPKKKAIQDMGDKIRSKQLAQRAGVNLIPGFIGEVTEKEVVNISREIGYPVMLKASAGGGGKGMRVAYTDQEALEGYRLAKAEAKSSFNDDRLLIEKYIEEPRHIEINVLGDQHGTILYFPERECSVQRRNQKVIEEAPSPFIDSDTRKKMGDQAVQLARAVDYESSGTVEFMVDKHKNFYFLEMNTRLQVEHPITELITGIDIVEEMIKVTMGRPLSFKQEDIQIKGHSVECRVYAENPFRGFLPSIGHLMKYQEPQHAHVRIDTGVREGDEISMFYDPLISKTVTWGQDRAEAIAHMKEALDSYVIQGLDHNIPFCRDVMVQPAFVRGEYSTKFIQETYPEGFMPSPLATATRLKFVSLLIRMREVSNSTAHYAPAGPYVIKVFSEFYGVVPAENSVFLMNPAGETQGEALCYRDSTVQWDNYSAMVRGTAAAQAFSCEFLSHTHSGYKLCFQGHKLRVDFFTPHQFHAQQYMPEDTDSVSASEFLAPMPGKLVSLTVSAGDTVEAGQELGVLEAMKMQNVLRAEFSGKVRAVHCRPEDSVQVDQLLFEFE